MIVMGTGMTTYLGEANLFTLLVNRLYKDDTSQIKLAILKKFKQAMTKHKKPS
jgi:hypothetical protein